MDPDFENKVKLSFLRVREHIEQLEQEIKQEKMRLDALIQKLDKIGSTGNVDSTPLKTRLDASSYNNSSGNEGVCASMHASMQACKQHLNIQTTPTNTNFDQNLEDFQLKPHKPTFKEVLSTLTNKEFIIFLTIYQLGEATYQDLAAKLTLTKGCVRSHVCSLLSKKAPILRKKINNWKVILSIDSDFKSLTSEQKLIEIYYQRDPSQTTLA